MSLINEYRQTNRHRCRSSGRYGAGNKQSMSLILLRHRTRIDTLYTTSPAFQECILFLLSSRQLLKTCLAGSCEKPAQKLTAQLPSAPGKMSPARILPLPRSPASPRPHSAAFPHLLSSGHSSGGRDRECQAPAHPTSFPQPCFRAGGGQLPSTQQRRENAAGRPR